MSEELNSWINEFWEKTKPPEMVVEKQVWVVFPLEESPDNPSKKGSIVVVLSTDEETASVVPAHHELSTRTFVDPILSKNDSDLDFDDRLVCVAHLPQRLSHQAFKNARFLGGLTDKGFEKVNAAVSNFYTVLDELARTQYLEATDSISDQDLENAFNAGILKIYPTKVSLKDLNSLDSALESNLLCWQEHAIEQVVCEEEKEYEGWMESVVDEAVRENTFVKEILHYFISNSTFDLNKRFTLNNCIQLGVGVLSAIITSCVPYYFYLNHIKSEVTLSQLFAMGLFPIITLIPYLVLRNSTLIETGTTHELKPELSEG